MAQKNLDHAGIQAFYRAAGSGEDVLIRRLKGEVRRRLHDESERTDRTSTDHEPQYQISRILHQLFHEEESLMIRTMYPDYEMQKKLHRYFLGEIHEEQNICNCCSDHDSFCHLIQFMHTWLRQHEFQSDRYFFLHLERWKKSRCPEKHEPDLLHLNPEYMMLPEKLQTREIQKDDVYFF